MTTSDGYPMLSVEEALDRILATVSPLEAETVDATAALGRVLAKDVYAVADIPPHDNSAMDGYAVRHADLSGMPPSLRVVGDLAAGHVWPGTIGPGEALRIMTGAPLPDGADTVVRFEDTSTASGADGSVRVLVQRVPKRGRNVRLCGEDVVAGSRVLARGRAVRPQEVGMLASLGHAHVRVHRRPRVAVLATGDELLGIDEPARPGKIRNINSYSNAAQVAECGGLPLVMATAPDREDTLTERLRQALDQGADLIVTSGGVSVGDFDLVKRVLSSEGTMDFWWVNMKPGKPMAYGALRGIPLLGLPGNPVAAMISFYLFGRPAVLRMLGHTCDAARLGLERTRATLAQTVAGKDDRRHYLRVSLSHSEGGLVAHVTGEQGSGILDSMVKAHGLAVIPEDTNDMPAGSEVEVLLFPSRLGTARAGGHTT